MAPGVGLVRGEVPKPVLRGGKIAFRQRFPLCSFNFFFIVLGEVPKPILRGGKIAFRGTFQANVFGMDLAARRSHN